MPAVTCTFRRACTIMRVDQRGHGNPAERRGTGRNDLPQPGRRSAQDPASRSLAATPPKPRSLLGESQRAIATSPCRGSTAQRVETLRPLRPHKDREFGYRPVVSLNLTPRRSSWNDASAPKAAILPRAKPLRWRTRRGWPFATSLVRLHDLWRLPGAVEDRLLSPVGADVKREVAVRSGQPIALIFLAGRFHACIEHE
jgi:hypothetical protein